MTSDVLRYDRMVEDALRGVVREALETTAADGPPGAHHFYLTFRTTAPGVVVPEFLLAQYPEEMTIVLQHQFWDLTVDEEGFSVTLSFSNRPVKLVVPFAALTSFVDPSVKFGLQFNVDAASEAADTGVGLAEVTAAEGQDDSADQATPAAPSADVDPTTADVVTLDSFRKK